MTADLDGDGQIEVVFANDMAPGDLFVRRGQRSENLGVASGTAYVRGQLRTGMGVDVGDFHGDGALDIIETGLVWDGANLLRDLRPFLYKDVAQASSVALATRPHMGFGSLLFDVDNNGWPDLFITNGHLSLNTDRLFPGTRFLEPMLLLYRGGEFWDLSAKVLGQAGRPTLGRSLAAGDYGQDGRVNLLAVDDAGQVVLLHNETRPSGHYLSVRLRDGNGLDAYGATLKASVGQRTLLYAYHADGSYVSASDSRAHLGLGPATEVTSLTVLWPSGRSERFGPLAADQRVELREGGRAAPTAAAAGGDPGGAAVDLGRAAARRTAPARLRGPVGDLPGVELLARESQEPGHGLCPPLPRRAGGVQGHHRLDARRGLAVRRLRATRRSAPTRLLPAAPARRPCAARAPRLAPPSTRWPGPATRSSR